jgi:thioredoxin reductase (NADPH)
MSRPVLLVVDDDEPALRLIERDLRGRYGDRYRVHGTTSPREALETLRKLKADGETVALLLADQRMPDVTGIEFLEQAVTLFPVAKRVLLTVYEDTEAAIRAIKTVGIDHYLVKPGQPPEQHLYPVLDDLLIDWEACVRPPVQGVRVVGYRFSPESHQTRDFLASNCVPFQWLDIERDEEARRLLAAAGVTASRLPLVRFPDGTQLVQPTNVEIAEKIGLRVHPDETFYDLVIVGAGPSGLAAAVYGASEGLRTVMVERHAPGGQAGLSAKIENYLGFPAGLSGTDLARRAVIQARKFEVEIVTPQLVTGLGAEGSSRVVTLTDGSTLRCHVALLAMGVQWRRLEVPGIERLIGAGVYYGGTLAEAFFCRNEDVYIVGGANAAGQAALHFARYARTVTMLVRGESLSGSMSQYLIDQIAHTKNVIVRLRTTVVEVHGAERLEAITLVDAAAGQKETIPASVLFIFIGAVPHTEWLDGVVARDRLGFVLTGPDLARLDGDGHRPRGWSLERDPFWLESSVPGIFAVGDVRHGSVKRVASGVGEGATAVQFIHEYLDSEVHQHSVNAGQAGARRE